MYIHTTALRGITCGSTGDKRQFFNRIESCSSAGHQRSAWRHEDTNLCKTAKTWPEVLAPIQEKYIQLSHILVKIIILVTSVNRKFSCLQNFEFVILVYKIFWYQQAIQKFYDDDLLLLTRCASDGVTTKRIAYSRPPYIYILTYEIQLLEWSWFMRGSPTMQQIGTPTPFCHRKIFVLLIFGYQQAIWKFFKHWKFSDYRKSYTVWCHLMQIHHRCSSIHWLSKWLFNSVTFVLKHSNEWGY